MPATKGRRPDAANQAPACPSPPITINPATTGVTHPIPTRWRSRSTA
jgi:hypothetical protein